MADVLRICVFERQRMVERYAEVGGQQLAHALRYGVDVAAVRSRERGLVVGHVLITDATGRIYQMVNKVYAADRLAAEVEDDNVARIQRRQIGEGNGTEGVRADREHICAAHGGNILLNAGRLPVTRAGFLHLDIDRVAAVGEGQLNDINIRAAANVGAHDALDLGHICDPAGFRAIDRIAEVIEGILRGGQGVGARQTAEVADLVGQAGQSQTGAVIQTEQLALRHIRVGQLGDVGDHAAAAVLTGGLHEIAGAHITDAAAVHAADDAVCAVVVSRDEHIVAHRGGGGAEFPGPLRAAGHIVLLRDEFLLLFGGEDGVDILSALVEQAARVLLREVGRGAVSGVFAVRPVLWQPALTELVHHGQDDLAVVAEGERYLGDVGGSAVGAAQLAGRRREAEQGFRRLRRVAAADGQSVGSRDEIRQTEVICVQQLEVVERGDKIVVVRVGGERVRADLKGHAGDQHVASLAGEVQPHRFAERNAGRRRMDVHCGHAVRVPHVLENDERGPGFGVIPGHIAPVDRGAGREIIIVFRKVAVRGEVFHICRRILVHIGLREGVRHEERARLSCRRVFFRADGDRAAEGGGEQGDKHDERCAALFDRLVEQALKPPHERLFVVSEAGNERLPPSGLRDGGAEDGLAVGAAVGCVLSANDRIVARKLNILLREAHDQIYERVEPVYALRRCQQQLEPQVAVTAVRQFVAEDEGGICGRNVLVRQIECRADKTREHRAVCGRGDQKRNFPGNTETAALRGQNIEQIGAFRRYCRAVQPPFQYSVADSLPDGGNDDAGEPQTEQDCGQVEGCRPACACMAERGRLFVRYPSGRHLLDRQTGLLGQHPVVLHHIIRARRDLHRRFRQRQLHRNEQPQREQRPDQTDRTRRIAFFEHAAQQQRHERRERNGQSGLHQIVHNLHIRNPHKIPSSLLLRVQKGTQLVDVLFAQRAGVRQARHEIFHRAAAQTPDKADAFALAVVLLRDERRIQVLPSLLGTGQKALVGETRQEREHARHFPVAARVMLYLCRRDGRRERPDGLHDLKLRIGKPFCLCHSQPSLFYKCKIPFIDYILQ